jgi:hypothetical protein
MKWLLHLLRCNTLLNAMCDADGNAGKSGRISHGLTGCQIALHLPQSDWWYGLPAKAPSLALSTLQTGSDALLDHRAFDSAKTPSAKC